MENENHRPVCINHRLDSTETSESLCKNENADSGSVQVSRYLRCLTLDGSEVA